MPSTNLRTHWRNSFQSGNSLTALHHRAGGKTSALILFIRGADMTTARNIFNKAISIIDELTDTGLINDAQVKEYSSRAPYLLDMWQKEMAKNGDLYKTFEIACTRKHNLLGDLNQYGIITENNGNADEYQANNARCFYLEVDGDCRVSFSEYGSPLSGKYVFNNGPETDFNETINITVPEGTTSFLPIKGILNDGGSVTMSITGDYYFRHNNRALCAYKYKSAEDVPDFKPWRRIEMPDDFKSRYQIVNEFPSWQYEESNNHRWEGNKELYVLFSYEGLIRIKYVPIPIEITSLDQTLEVDDITATSGAYYLAEHFAISDMNEDLARICRNKYRELKMESMIKNPLSATEIVDIYGVSR